MGSTSTTSFDPEGGTPLRAELYAFYTSLSVPNRDELRHIYDAIDRMNIHDPAKTFSVLTRHEHSRCGESRTHQLVLEVWDRLFEDRQVVSLNNRQILANS